MACGRIKYKNAFQLGPSMPKDIPVNTIPPDDKIFSVKMTNLSTNIVSRLTY